MTLRSGSALKSRDLETKSQNLEKKMDESRERLKETNQEREMKKNELR